MRNDEDLSFPNNQDVPPAIPDGEQYELCFIRAEKTFQFNGYRVFLWFEMHTAGSWNGERFYMTATVDPKGKWGPSWKYWQAWVLAAGRRPRKKEGLSTKVFKGKLFRCRLRVVLKTSKQRLRTPEQQYSVVDELLEVVAGR